MDYKAWFEGMAYERAREDDAINELFACIETAYEGGRIDHMQMDNLMVTLFTLIRKSRNQPL